MNQMNCNLVQPIQLKVNGNKWTQKWNSTHKFVPRISEKSNTNFGNTWENEWFFRKININLILDVTSAFQLCNSFFFASSNTDSWSSIILSRCLCVWFRQNQRKRTECEQQICIWYSSFFRLAKSIWILIMCVTFCDRRIVKNTKRWSNRCRHHNEQTILSFDKFQLFTSRLLPVCDMNSTNFLLIKCCYNN